MKIRKQSFGYRFAMLYRLHSVISSEKISKLGLTMSQVPFMAELFHSEKALTQNELSKKVAIDKAATARTLDQLEKNGFVTRTVNPDNRRQNLIRTTDKGIAVKERLISILLQTSNAYVKGFTEKEKAVALDLLDRMLENARNACDESK